MPLISPLMPVPQYRAIYAQEINPTTYLLWTQPGFKPQSFCCPNKYSNEKSARRDANTARVLAVRPPAHYTPTDRTDYNTLRRS